MFEARLSESSLLKKVLEAVKDLIEDDDFSWNCSGSGMQLQATDSSGSVITSLLLPPGVFNKYRCDQPLLLRMKLDNMSKILKCARDDDCITISATDSPDSVMFRIDPVGCDISSRYEMKLMDMETASIIDYEPEMTSSCVIEMSATRFQNICRDLSKIGKSMTIDCAQNGGEAGVTFSASGDLGDFYSGDINFERGGEEGKEDFLDIKMEDGSVAGTFDLKYLNLSTAATPLSDVVILSLSPDGPLGIEYRILHMGHIRYRVVQKFEDEEEAA